MLASFEIVGYKFESVVFHYSFVHILVFKFSS